MANGGGDGFFFGSSLTFADVAVFCMVRGWRSSAPEDYEARAAASPKLRAFTARMDAEPRVAAFLASERCTAMEAATSGPLAVAPHVQVNTLM